MAYLDVGREDGEAVLEHGGQQRRQARQRHQPQQVALLVARQATHGGRHVARQLRLPLVQGLAAALLGVYHTNIILDLLKFHYSNSISIFTRLLCLEKSSLLSACQAIMFLDKPQN